MEYACGKKFQDETWNPVFKGTIGKEQRLLQYDHQVGKEKRDQNHEQCC